MHEKSLQNALHNHLKMKFYDSIIHIPPSKMAGMAPPKPPGSFGKKTPPAFQIIFTQLQLLRPRIIFVDPWVGGWKTSRGFWWEIFC